MVLGAHFPPYPSFCWADLFSKIIGFTLGWICTNRVNFMKIGSKRRPVSRILILHKYVYICITFWGSFPKYRQKNPKLAVLFEKIVNLGYYRKSKFFVYVIFEMAIIILNSKYANQYQLNFEIEIWICCCFDPFAPPSPSPKKFEGRKFFTLSPPTTIFVPPPHSPPLNLLPLFPTSNSDVIVVSISYSMPVVQRILGFFCFLFNQIAAASQTMHPLSVLSRLAQISFQRSSRLLLTREKIVAVET